MASTPYLYYQDVDRTLTFLAKAFGLRRHGGSPVMMGRPGSGHRNPKRLGQATRGLYINVSDVDIHFRHARKAGAAILQEPADTEYGHRRYGAVDPEGHEWYFAQVIRRRKCR